MSNFLILIFSFLGTYLSLFVLVPIFKKKIIDLPNSRSMHSVPTPRAGGIAFVSWSLITLVINGNLKALIILPLALIGLLDDIYNIKPKIRFIVQVTTTLLFLFTSNINEDLYEYGIIFYLIFIIFYLLISTGFINFMNFMDGIDGIVAGSMCVVLVSAFIMGEIYLAGSIGALIAFLIWNWNPAKIFMGDVGSTSLGALFIFIIFNFDNFELALALSLIVSPLVMDSFTCLIRRSLKSHKIFEAHSLHLYQRLNKAGLSHSKISLIYIFSSIIISLSYFLGGLLYSLLSTTIILIVGIWLDKNVAADF